jgi:DNA-binding MarR family transcriptional regulator
MNQADGAASTTAHPHFMLSILHAAQAISDRLESSLAKIGLSVAKQSALSALAESREPLTLGELASKLSCVRSNITQLVDRLEADGLVRRVDDPEDRRSVRAELTALGREKQAAGAIAIARVQDELGGLVSVEDLGSLESALAALG